MLEQICKALGWQGGTVHQVLEEITRLRKAESLLRACQDRMKFEANSEGGMHRHIDNELPPRRCGYCSEWYGHTRNCNRPSRYR